MRDERAHGARSPFGGRLTAAVSVAVVCLAVTAPDAAAAGRDGPAVEVPTGGVASARDRRAPATREVAGRKSTREDTLAVATFAGGCFWCMEPPFEKLDGVREVVSGYTGGELENPTYEQVSSGGTGHLEAVQVHYDPDLISYDDLLYVFWRNVDPTDAGGQFCDRGSQYGTAIFVHDQRQREAARRSKEQLERTRPFEGPVVTEIRQLEAFYRAEDYHQDYYENHAIRYKFYRLSCGRDRVLRQLWGDEAGGPAG